MDVIPLLLLQAWETFFSIQLFSTQTLDPHGVLSYEMPLNWIEGDGSGQCGLLSHSRNRLCGLQSLCFLKGGRHSSELKPHEALWTPFLSLFLSLSHTYACTHTLLTTLKWAHTSQFVDKRPCTGDPSCTKTILDQITASQFPDIENKLMITKGERQKEKDKLGTCD